MKASRSMLRCLAAAALLTALPFAPLKADPVTAGLTATAHYSSQVGWGGLAGAARTLGNGYSGFGLATAAVKGDTAAVIGKVSGIAVSGVAMLDPRTRFAAAPLGIATETLVTNSYRYANDTPSKRLLVDIVAERHGVDYNSITPKRYTALDIEIALYEAVIEAERNAPLPRTGLPAWNLRLDEDLRRLKETRAARDAERAARIPARGFQAPQYLPPSSAARNIASPSPKVARTTVQSCIATESELFQIFEKDGGSMLANNQVIHISNLPTTEVLSREPEFTYRLNDPVLCRDLGKTGEVANTMPANTRAVIDRTLSFRSSPLLWQWITEACQGAGTLPEEKLAKADLDQDGDLDFIVDSEHFQCQNIRVPNTCGVQVCESRIYMTGPKGFSVALEMLNSVGTIEPGNPPAINVYSHGGGSGKLRWTGSGFSAN